MTDKERTAIAMLRSGSSWKEASDLTGTPVDRLMELWQQRQKTA